MKITPIESRLSLKSTLGEMEAFLATMFVEKEFEARRRTLKKEVEERERQLKVVREKLKEERREENKWCLKNRIGILETEKWNLKKKMTAM